MTTVVQAAEPLDPSSLLETHAFGRSFEWLPSTTSTNTVARERALAGAPHGHVVVADHQTSGRGSNGRSWESPPGTDLYLSIVTRPTIDFAQLAALTLAVGLGVAEALPVQDAMIKWPNDIYFSDRKCCGILVESFGARTHPIAIIGIGVNVNRESFEGELREVATSLRNESGQSHDRTVVLAELIQGVERRYDEFIARGLAPMHDAIKARLRGLGQSVTIDGARGTLLGLAPNGALTVQFESGVRDVHSGQLQFV